MMAELAWSAVLKIQADGHSQSEIVNDPERRCPGNDEAIVSVPEDPLTESLFDRGR